MARSWASPNGVATDRNDAAPIVVAVSTVDSTIAASASAEAESNAANAPPVVRARTLSQRPGIPSPRMPNWESCARAGRAPASRTPASSRKRRLGVMG